MELESTPVDANVEAAFSASFHDTPLETVAPSEAKIEPKAIEVKEAAPTAPSPVALTIEELTQLRATASKVNEFQADLRKAYGRIGALNDQLQQTMRQKEEQGKPATLTPMELKKTREEFPELAEIIGSDLQAYFAANGQQGSAADVDAKVEKKLSAQREALDKQAIEERQEELETDHPDARQVFASDTFYQWMKSLPESEQATIARTKSPHVLSRKLTVFKSWRDEQSSKSSAATATKEKKQERLEAAITPKGAGRSSQTTLSEREEMEKGLSIGFNS